MPYKATPIESRKYKGDGALYANQREHDETPEQFGQRLKRDIASRPDWYYQRGTVVRLDEEREKASRDLWETAAMVREGRFPRNSGACVQWGKTCAFLDLCTGIGSPEQFERVDNVHTELSL